MNIISVAGTAFVGCVAAMAVKRFDASGGVLVSLMCAVVISAFCFTRLGAFVDFADGVSIAGEYDEYFPVMLKGLSIAFICECACDICRDCGESSIASKVEFAGKIELLLLSLPLLRSVIDLSRNMLSS